MTTSTEDRDRLLRDFIKQSGLSPKAKEDDKEVEVKPLIEKAVETEGDITIGELTGDHASKFSHYKTHQYDDTDWPEYMRVWIPKVDNNFVPTDPFYRMWLASDAGFNVFTHGPSGSGKDTAAEQYCAYRRIPYRRITGMEGMLPDVAIGSISLNEKGTFFKPGDAYHICRDGGMLVLSEPAAMTRVMFALQSALEDGGHLSIPDHPDESDRMLPVNEKTIFVATSNVRGVGDKRSKHSATDIMDSSTINRFQCTLHFPYMNAIMEKQVIANHFPTVSKDLITKVVKFSNLVREAVEKRQIKADWSLRTSLPWIRMSLIYGDMAEGLRTTYFDKLDDAEKGAVQAFWESVSFTDKL